MSPAQYGTVVTSANEQSTVAGFEGVATGIRSVVMSGNRDQIPHLLQVADPVTAETYKLLCVITGRKPLFEMQTCRSLSSELHYTLLPTS